LVEIELKPILEPGEGGVTHFLSSLFGRPWHLHNDRSKRNDRAISGST
jgi:hypothetical protein